MNPLIFGNDDTPNIVAFEVFENSIELFIEKNGKVTSDIRPHQYWILSTFPYDESWERLKGNLHYKYIKYFDNIADFYVTKRELKNCDTYSVADAKEASMMLYGHTYFKGMRVEDVSALFFDIEATTVQHNSSSKVLLISNTFVKNGVITRKMFAYDNYQTDAEFFDAWCSWVKEVNPSIVSGHNIFGYDLPYLSYCANRAGTSLYLGRNGSAIRFNRYASKFRKDGSQDYDYYRAFIYGREIVDTMFLAYHFDFARKYESYGLKQIIKQEGLEKENRQFYDASTIGKNYLDPTEWSKIKAYAEHDADDAYALYRLMIGSYFYVSSAIPKSFQAINLSATGSQINAMLIRSYLQDGHSIPKADRIVPFEGAISFGVPNLYKNMIKIDFNALYPSIIRTFKIFDKVKDPNSNLLKIVEYFSDYRNTNKRLAKETGDRYYTEVEQSTKIVSNSIYGLMGAQLNFNYPKGAALVTKIARELMKFSILWATSKKYEYWQALFEEKTSG